MKRIVSLALAALLLTGCSFGTRVYTNEPTSTIPDMELVVEKYYFIAEINREYADGRTERTEYERAEKPLRRDDGQIREYNCAMAVYENEVSVRCESYEVDDRGNVIRMIPNGDETSAEEYQLRYDENYNITEKQTFVAGEERRCEIFFYNERGQVTEHSVYEKDALVQRTVTEYGENGWRTAVVTYDGAGEILTRMECTADLEKYKETVLEYDGAGVLLRRMENGYDIGMNLVAQEVFDGEGNSLERTYWRYVSGSYSYLAPAGE